MVAVPFNQLNIENTPISEKDWYETKWQDGWDYYNEVLEPQGLTQTSPWFDCGIEEGYIGIEIDATDIPNLSKSIELATTRLSTFTKATPVFGAYVDVY